MKNPTAFVSYEWDTEESNFWVKNLATVLRKNGIDVKLDIWEVSPGDLLPNFMEQAVRENDYVLIICSPRYKEKSQARKGGVGYEGNIITGELFEFSNHKKFIPVLQAGESGDSIPNWLLGKYYVDLSSDEKFERNLLDLFTTIVGEREKAPDLGKLNVSTILKMNNPSIVDDQSADIKILGVIVDEVTSPKNDGSQVSALYNVPFKLNIVPDRRWSELFVQIWNRPPRFSLMHRPGIASVSGNKIFLNGTTMEEVEKTHKATLDLVIKTTNERFDILLEEERINAIKEQQAFNEHRRNIADISKRLNFDD